MISDPIVALATPPGRSALAVVRVSGTGAFDIVSRVAPDWEPEPRMARLVRFVGADGSEIDRGICIAFPGPASYTGEDVAELTCHGGLLTPARLIAALQAAGARPAAPGEFTRRAVMNGKMDLVQAEAVGDLIDAAAPRQARAALDQLDGALSRRVADLRDRLIELQALLGYQIDFPEEDDGPVPPARIAAELERVLTDVERLLATAPSGERLRDGALVVLAGRPNAGKSSLFNALLGADRALVTDLPGTTRDAIEAATSVSGWPLRLVDTAGLRDSDDRVERMGVEVSRRYLTAADLVLLCIESGQEVTSEEEALMAAHPVMPVRTKGDLVPGDDAVSVVTGEGLAALRRALAERLFAAGPAGDMEPLLTRARHREALARAADELALARPHLLPEGDAVLAAHHVRQATLILDELMGVVDVEEILDRIFAAFCVGK